MSKYDKAGLAMIPSGYKDSKVYSLIPNSSDGDFDFTRGSIATRVNKDGLIDTVASGVPRLEYPLIDGVVQDTPSLLLEPSRTNLVTYSEDFTDVSWLKTNTSITANSIISPDGALNGSLVTISATGTDCRHTCNVVPIAQYYFSFYVKKGTSTNMTYRVYDVTNGSNIVNPTSYYNDIGEDWTRVGIQFTSPSGCNQVFVYVSSDNADVGTFYLWGAQLEAGSYPTSYIPTSGTTVTRAAETCDGAGTSAEFNDSEGVLFAEISALADDGTSRNITISDGTANNRVFLKLSSTSNFLEATVVSNGVVAIQETYSINNTTIFNKLVLKYKQNNFSFWVNGFEVGTDLSGNAPSGLNVLDFDSAIYVNDFYGKTKQLITFKEALTDSELEDLTSWDSFNEMATAQEYSIK